MAASAAFLAASTLAEEAVVALMVASAAALVASAAAPVAAETAGAGAGRDGGRCHGCKSFLFLATGGKGGGGDDGGQDAGVQPRGAAAGRRCLDPAFHKRRVGSLHGHLSNADAATLAQPMDHAALEHVYAAHLNLKYNRPDLARAAIAVALKRKPEQIGITDPTHGMPWV